MLRAHIKLVFCVSACVREREALALSGGFYACWFALSFSLSLLALFSLLLYPYIALRQHEQQQPAAAVQLLASTSLAFSLSPSLLVVVVVVVVVAVRRGCRERGREEIGGAIFVALLSPRCGPTLSSSRSAQSRDVEKSRMRGGREKEREGNYVRRAYIREDRREAG